MIADIWNENFWHYTVKNLGDDLDCSCHICYAQFCEKWTLTINKTNSMMQSCWGARDSEVEKEMEGNDEVIASMMNNTEDNESESKLDDNQKIKISHTEGKHVLEIVLSVEQEGS